MLDDLKEEGIVNKVGGRFKLSTLIQKRLVQLNAGSRPLVVLPTDNMMAIVLQEIIQDKITLDTGLQISKEDAAVITEQEPKWVSFSGSNEVLIDSDRILVEYRRMMRQHSSP